MSSSLLTNISAMTALQALSRTQQALSSVQGQISTGLKVSGASDNAAYWSIATTMRSDNDALGSVQDSLNLGASTVGVANSAMTATVSIMNQMKADLVTASTPGVDRSKIQSDITALQAQLRSISSSASFNGENWLSVDSTSPGYNATKSIVASFSRDSTGALTIGTIAVDTSTTKTYDAASSTAAFTAAVAPLATTLATDNLANNAAQALAKQTGAAADIAAAAATQATVDADTAALAAGQTGAGILDKTRVVSGTVLTGGIAALNVTGLTDSTNDLQTLHDYIDMVDNALTDLTNAAATLGSTQTRVTLQTNFVSALKDAITSGIGSLVDADMNQASTRLQALQTQQQLGIQSLSIANQNTQLILKLFGA
jgi:flagellin